MDWLEGYFQTLILNFLRAAAHGFFEALNGLTSDVTGLVNVNPGTYNPTIFAMIQNISEVAIVPVACLILCYLMTINFIKIIEDRNTYKDLTFMPVFKWILYTTIGIVLITKTYTIVLAIFDVIGFILEFFGFFADTGEHLSHAGNKLCNLAAHDTDLVIARGVNRDGEVAL